MENSVNMQEVARGIDSLLTLDLPGRGRIDLLYKHFRERSSIPLSLAAAAKLGSIRDGQLVFIATGFLNRPQVTSRIAESDGPTGAASLARAVHRGVGAIPVILVEEELVEAMALVLHAAGMSALTLDEAVRAHEEGALLQPAAVVGWPREEDPLGVLEQLVGDRTVGAFVAIEKGGRNERGVAHMSQGRPCTETVADMGPLIEWCRRYDVPTIGVGDGGNEIGMGNDGGSLADVLPYGLDCGCGCGGGVIPAVETDAVLPVAVSNWGGYGLAALLAVMVGRLDVMHDEEIEERMLSACSAAGLIDGATGATEPTSDGLDLFVHQAVVSLLRTLIGEGIDNSAWPASAASGLEGDVG